MKKRNLLYCFLSFALLAMGCRQAAAPDASPHGVRDAAAPQDTLASSNGKTVLVDYKSDTYKIAIGESYTISDQKIDWHWDHMADEGYPIDSTGQDAFLSTGEPLFRFKDGEFLPALFISTDRNIITKFSCEMLVDGIETSADAAGFLELMARDIQCLRQMEVSQALLKQGTYTRMREGCVETLELLRGDSTDFDHFSYSIAPAKTEKQ